MKKWRLKNIFFLSGRFFALALIFVFSIFFTNNVKAAGSVYLDSYFNIDSNGDETRNDPNFSISFEVPTDCPNPYLLTISTSWNGNVLVSASYNGDSLTKLWEDDTVAGGNLRGGIFGLANPDTGTNTLAFATDSIGERPTIVALYCNVDPNDPIGTAFILAETSNQTSLDSGSITDYENPSSALVSILYMYETDSSTTVPDGSVLSTQTDTWNGGRLALALNDDVSNPPAQFSWIKNAGYVASLLYGVLNPAPASGCSPGFVLVNDVCTLTDLLGYHLFFSSPYSCSNTSSCKIDYSYDQDFFTPYDYIEYFHYDSATSTSPTSIGTSTVVDSSVFGKENGNSFLTLTGTSTLSGLQYYDVVGHMAEYYDYSLATTVPATTTAATMFYVNWGTTEIVDWTDNFVSDSSMLGIDIAHAICTDEEWNTPDPVFDWGFATTSLPIFNITAMKCGTILSVVQIGEKLANIPAKLVKALAFSLKHLFPFNLAINFYNAWQSAQSLSMPNDLTFFNIAKIDGEIGFDLPPEWNGTASSTHIVVFGTSIFEDENARMATVYAGIRNLSTYLIWGLFIFLLFRMAEALMHEILDRSSKD